MWQAEHELAMCLCGNVCPSEPSDMGCAFFKGEIQESDYKTLLAFVKVYLEN